MLRNPVRLILALRQHHLTRTRRSPRTSGVANAVVQGFLSGDVQAGAPGQAALADRWQGFGVAGIADA